MIVAISTVTLLGQWIKKIKKAHTFTIKFAAKVKYQPFSVNSELLPTHLWSIAF